MTCPSMWTVESFLATIGVDESDVDSAAAALMDAGYKTERYLLSARSEHLEKVGIPFPVIDLILAHQEKVAPQQQHQQVVNTNVLQQDDDTVLELDKAMAALNLTGFSANTRFLSFLKRLQEDLAQNAHPLALRKAPCRLWVGDDSRTLYNLNATSFQALDEAVRSTFQLEDEEIVSLYYILDKEAVESRRYISNDHDLDKYFNLAADPIIFVWLRGESNISPGSLPSEIEIKVASVTSSQSSVSNRTRGYAQTLFRNAVRERDGLACVLSGKKLKPKANNVQAAHIIGVETDMSAARKTAGVVNAYDTWNGMLLETSLHSAFDSYLWCMDEFCIVHVSEKGKEHGFGMWEGKRVKLHVGQPLYPSRELLRARFQLYEDKKVQPKPVREARRKYGVQTV